MAQSWRIGVDTGGTFTDGSVERGADGRIITAKLLSTPSQIPAVPFWPWLIGCSPVYPPKRRRRYPTWHMYDGGHERRSATSACAMCPDHHLWLSRHAGDRTPGPRRRIRRFRRKSHRQWCLVISVEVIERLDALGTSAYSARPARRGTRGNTKSRLLASRR